MENHRKGDDPWRPGWDPRRLATLTRPDPRYYRYVPDLSGYFVVAHYQTPDWRPGEGDPGSIRWLREEAPELIVDGRLRVDREEVGGETRSCLAVTGGGRAAAAASVRAQAQQKSPSSAPPVSRPFGGRPEWGNGEAASYQSYGLARDYPQHGSEGWQTGEINSQPVLQQQQNQNLQDCGFQGHQSHSIEQANSRTYGTLQQKQQRPTPERKPSNESSDDPRRSWIWPETSEVASSGQQLDPRHLRISRDVLAEIHQLPMGHPQSPWGWPENSDESGVTEAESIGMREARRRHNAEIEKRAPHPQRYIRPSSPSIGNQGPCRDSRHGSTSSSSNSSSSGFPMRVPQWPGAQERYAGSRDSPSYLHGTQRISDESQNYTDSSGSGDTLEHRRGNYVYGGFEEPDGGPGARKGPCLENQFATLQIGRDEGRYNDDCSTAQYHLGIIFHKEVNSQGIVGHQKTSGAINHECSSNNNPSPSDTRRQIFSFSCRRPDGSTAYMTRPTTGLNCRLIEVVTQKIETVSLRR
ncbi:hypothetical protein PpBr36_03839 [Pyricularia pennisetigena]|uniref:hypothetical protein n=1 Tax=Pyricularia pennisetigena TaxID=1578925 RepID=UPI001154196B|nr:hypothetical protein PpBr36_03839 [Pyricularia pennisetigena]TLS30459.1 hypothetical protein PpBr36_03839 [Pyricularia pennisetigena]